MIILLILLLVFASEAVAEIITSSKLTDPFRAWWKKWTFPAEHPPPDTPLQHFRVWFDYLISCGYCTSVWTSGFFALFAPAVIPNSFCNWLVMTFAIHRLANWLHVLYERIRKGRVFEADINLIHASPVEDENGSP
jgi:hypothetical protein